MNLNLILSMNKDIGKRLLWESVRMILFRPFCGRFFMPWRGLLLRVFGAKLARGAHVYASARIREPWNLEMGKDSCLASESICYNVDKVILEERATVSQRSFLCTASHDIDSPHHPLITAPIRICSHAWVAAEAFIGMGVTVGEGAVVGARASVFRDVAPWHVVGGNPAIFIRNRVKVI